LTATLKSMPAVAPECASRSGSTSFSVVPGGTVLRTTTHAHWPARRSASPTAAAAARTCVRSGRSATVGVGTDRR